MVSSINIYFKFFKLLYQILTEVRKLLDRFLIGHRTISQSTKLLNISQTLNATEGGNTVEYYTSQMLLQEIFLLF